MTLITAIFIGVVLGISSGYFIGPPMTSVQFLGDIFLNALKMIVVPLIMLSMISGVGSLGDPKKLGRIGAVTVFYFLCTTFVALVIGLTVGSIMQPGIGFDLGVSVSRDAIQVDDFSVGQMISGLVHPNLFKAMSEAEILPLILFSLAFGLVLLGLKETGERLFQLIEDLNKVFMKLVHYVILFSPIGIFALISSRMGQAMAEGRFIEEMQTLGFYTVTVLVGLMIHAFIFIPSLLFFLGKKNPILYFSRMGDALMTALGTSSSSATLPVTMEAVEVHNKMNPKTASFVLPLGTTINMDGTALYQAVSVAFIAQAYGLSLGIKEIFLITFTATLSSIGTAGIPQSGLVTLVIVLKAAGLPMEGVAFILAVDWLVDRARTTVNVWGDGTAVAVVDRLVGFK
jgi:Na+/H+-dicarboxylate symporter